MSVKVREKIKGSGEWWIFIHHKGGRRSLKVGDKSKANRLKKDLEYNLAKKDLGLITNNLAPTFKEYTQGWLLFIEKRRAKTTFTRYRGIVEQHLEKPLGNKRLNEITRGDLRDLLLDKYSSGAAPGSVELMHTVLSGVFNHAIDDEILPHNPASNILKRLDFKREKKDIQPLSQEETEDVLSFISENYPDLYLFFLTAFKTGARIGELCALEWRDVDYRRKTVKICKTAKDQHIKPTTKTYISRSVDLTDQLSTALIQGKKNDKEHCFKLGIKQKHIFHSRGLLLAQNTIRRKWERALDQCGISHKRLHDIRHTFASTLLSRSVPLLYVSHQLGHSSPNITLNVYGHFMPSENKGLVNVLDGGINTDYNVTAD